MIIIIDLRNDISYFELYVINTPQQLSPQNYNQRQFGSEFYSLLPKYSWTCLATTLAEHVRKHRYLHKVKCIYYQYTAVYYTPFLFNWISMYNIYITYQVNYFSFIT